MEILRQGEVVEMEPVPLGITHPRLVLLRLADHRIRAVWKTIDAFEPSRRFEDGTLQLNFRDSWRHEVAAYELDKLLRLGLVPPTVERRLGRERGALQLWLEGALSEADRMARGLQALDREQWNEQIFRVRLFLQLIGDTDYRNVNNLLVDESFRMYVIDSSRAFTLKKDLLAVKDLTRFSRRLLARVAALDFETLRATLSPWLTKPQVRALLERRDRILERAAERVQQIGETVTFYP